MKSTKKEEKRKMPNCKTIVKSNEIILQSFWKTKTIRYGQQLFMVFAQVMVKSLLSLFLRLALLAANLIGAGTALVAV